MVREQAESLPRLDLFAELDLEFLDLIQCVARPRCRCRRIGGLGPGRHRHGHFGDDLALLDLVDLIGRETKHLKLPAEVENQRR